MKGALSCSHCFPLFFVFVLLLGSSQHFFSHVGMGLSGLNQYLAGDKVLCSQRSDSTSRESRTSNPSIQSLMLYQLIQCAPPTLLVFISL